MKQGGALKLVDGFTIVETLIVLAVTGALFASAVLLINGRQSKTEFQTAINGVVQQIQQVINQTSSGYFPSSNNFSCQAGAIGPPSVTSGGSGSGQGTNLGCVFVGKVMQFGVHNTDPENFIVWPITGNQNAQTIATAYPQPVQSIIETGTLSNGLSTYSMYYDNAPNQKTAGLGILAGDSSGIISTAGSSGLNSSAEQFSLYAISGTIVQSTDQGAMDNALKANPGLNHYAQVNSVEICFASGGTQQSGLVTIGGASSVGVGRQLTVTLQIHGNTTCS